jgi:CDP-diacylglycerol--serine O-phosphatidyltransferase
VGIATRASFVLVVYMGAYIVLGLAESVFFRARQLEAAQLPPKVRAEIEADEALEADDEDVESKDEGDEYI